MSRRILTETFCEGDFEVKFHSFSDYDCFRYTLEEFKEKARILKEGCFLVEIIPSEFERRTLINNCSL